MKRVAKVLTFHLVIYQPSLNNTDKPLQKPAIFVTTVDQTLAGKMQRDLVDQGFEISKPQYTLFAAKKPGIACTFYQSGKLTVQGKEMASFIEFYLEPEILKSFEFSHAESLMDLTPRLGVDESGKGDFFGPLCVAGVYAKGDEIAELKKLGVKDSKSLNDVTIEKIAKAIRAKYAHYILKINPLKYNELYAKFGNLNHLLAWGHATVIENLAAQTGCQHAIVDQFADKQVVERAVARKKLEIKITQRHRAEEDLVVAAASILSRYAFVEGLHRLSEGAGILLPKGASQQVIAAGKKVVRTHGVDYLQNVAKLHFKTLDAILEEYPQ